MFICCPLVMLKQTSFNGRVERGSGVIENLACSDVATCFYGQWMPRYNDVKKLINPEDLTDCALNHGALNMAINPEGSDCLVSSLLVKVIL